MDRFYKSLAMSLVFTVYIMCFYFFIAVFQAILSGTDVVQAALNSVIVGAVLFSFLSFLFYQLHGWIDERNRRDSEQRRDRRLGPGPGAGPAPNHPDDPTA